MSSIDQSSGVVRTSRGSRTGPNERDSSAWSSRLSTPSATRPSTSGSRSQPSTSVASSGGHHDSTKSTNAAVPSRVSLNSSRPRSRPRSPRTWRHIASSSAFATRGTCRLRLPWDEQLAADRGELARTEHQVVVAVEHPQVAGRGRHGLARGTTHQLGHPRGALDVGHGRLVVAGGAQAVDDLAEGAQRHGGLAQRRQHPLDVAHEHAGRADDQHAAALVAGPVAVEQERRAVQRDDGLAGAGTTGDRHDALARRPDRLVLLGLDGGHDGVHGAVAGPAELRHQRALADHDQVGLDLGVEQVVLDGDDLGAGAPQHPTSYDALRIRGRGLVEHRRRGGPPVDQQRVAVLVAQPDPADVARRLPGRGQVEAAEHQALVGGVQGRDPLGGLEDHRVALDETALVAEVRTAVALARQLLGVLGGPLELFVDAVDELLLVLELLLRHRVVRGLVDRQASAPGCGQNLFGQVRNSTPCSGGLVAVSRQLPPGDPAVR